MFERPKCGEGKPEVVRRAHTSVFSQSRDLLVRQLKDFLLVVSGGLSLL
jgi:hypothetical protein